MRIHGKETEELHKGVEEFYSNTVLREWKRLKRKIGHESVMEFYTTMQFLEKYLPKKGLILDAGSGPGRYSIELAKRGYRVVMLDPIKESVEFGKRAFRRKGLSSRLEGAYVGRIEDLGMFKDNTFDAVLCLGAPLSHVMDEKLREKSASELVRVAKRRAPVMVAVIGRLSLLWAIPERFPNEIEGEYFKTWYEKGDYSGEFGGFAPFHGFRSEELKDLFGKKLDIKAMVALEGFLSLQRGTTLTKLYRNKKRFGLWLKLHHKYWEDPTVVDISSHMMLIGKK